MPLLGLDVETPMKPPSKKSAPEQQPLPVDPPS
jgi:hypothetical protein